MAPLRSFTGDFSGAVLAIRPYIPEKGWMNFIYPPGGVPSIETINDQISRDFPRTGYLSQTYTVSDIKSAWMAGRVDRHINYIQGGMTSRTLTEQPFKNRFVSDFEGNLVTFLEGNSYVNSIEGAFIDKSGVTCGISVSFLTHQPSKFILILTRNSTASVKEREVRILAHDEMFKDALHVDGISETFKQSSVVPKQQSREALMAFISHINDDFVEATFSSFFEGDTPYLQVNKANVTAFSAEKSVTGSLDNLNIGNWPQQWLQQQQLRLQALIDVAQSDKLLALYDVFAQQLKFLSNQPYTRIGENFTAQKRLVSQTLSALEKGNLTQTDAGIDELKDVLEQCLSLLLIDNSIETFSDNTAKLKEPHFNIKQRKMVIELERAYNPYLTSDSVVSATVQPEPRLKHLESINKLLADVEATENLKSAVIERQSSKAGQAHLQQNAKSIFDIIVAANVAHQHNEWHKFLSEDVAEKSRRQSPRLIQRLKSLSFDEHQKLSEEEKADILKVSEVFAEYVTVTESLSRYLAQQHAWPESLEQAFQAELKRQLQLANEPQAQQEASADSNPKGIQRQLLTEFRQQRKSQLEQHRLPQMKAMETQLLDMVDGILDQKGGLDIDGYQAQVSVLTLVSDFLSVCYARGDAAKSIIPLINSLLGVEVQNSSEIQAFRDRLIDKGEDILALLTKHADLESLSLAIYPQWVRDTLNASSEACLQWLLTGEGDFYKSQALSQRTLAIVPLVREFYGLRANHAELLEVNKAQITKIEKDLKAFSEDGKVDLEKIQGDITLLQQQFALQQFANQHAQQQSERQLKALGLTASKAKTWAGEDGLKLAERVEDLSGSDFTLADRLCALKDYVADMGEKTARLRQLIIIQDNFGSDCELVSYAQKLFDELFAAVFFDGDITSLQACYWQYTKVFELIIKLNELYELAETLPEGYRQSIVEQLKLLITETRPSLTDITAFVQKFDDIHEVLSSLFNKQMIIEAQFDETNPVRQLFDELHSDCDKYLYAHTDVSKESISERFKQLRTVWSYMLNPPEEARAAQYPTKLFNRLNQQFEQYLTEKKLTEAAAQITTCMAWCKRWDIIIDAERAYNKLKYDVSIFGVEAALHRQETLFHQKRLSAVNELHMDTLLRYADVSGLLGGIVNVRKKLAAYRFLSKTHEQLAKLESELITYIGENTDNLPALAQNYRALTLKVECLDDVMALAREFGLDVKEKRTLNLIKLLLKVVDDAELSDEATNAAIDRVQRICPSLFKEFSALNKLAKAFPFADGDQKPYHLQVVDAIKGKTNALKQALSEGIEETFAYYQRFTDGDETKIIDELVEIETWLAPGGSLARTEGAFNLRGTLYELKQNLALRLAPEEEGIELGDEKSFISGHRQFTDQIYTQYRELLYKRLTDSMLDLKALGNKLRKLTLHNTSQEFTQKVAILSTHSGCLKALAREPRITLSLDRLKAYEDKINALVTEANQKKAELVASAGAFFNESINGFTARIDTLIIAQQAIDETLGTSTTAKVQAAKQRLEALKQRSFTIDSAEQAVKQIDTTIKGLEAGQRKASAYAREHNSSFFRRNLGTMVTFAFMSLATLVGAILIASGVFSPIGVVIAGLSAIKLAGIVTGSCAFLSIASGSLCYHKHKQAKKAEAAVNVFSSSIDTLAKAPLPVDEQAISHSKLSLLSRRRSLSESSVLPASPSQGGLRRSNSASQLMGKFGGPLQSNVIPRERVEERVDAPAIVSSV